MNNTAQSWQSDAGNTIRDRFNALAPKFDQYREVVDSYAKFLDMTVTSYDATETNINSAASSLQVDRPGRSRHDAHPRQLRQRVPPGGALAALGEEHRRAADALDAQRSALAASWRDPAGAAYAAAAAQLARRCGPPPTN